MKNINTYLSVGAIILAIAAIAMSLRQNSILGSSIVTTNSSDTLETFRTNVNASLTSLQTDRVSTTSIQTWTAQQNLFGGASTTDLSANTVRVGGTSTTTISNTGVVAVASSSPFGLVSINPNGISGPALVIGSTTSTYLIVTNGGRTGVGSSSPMSTLGIGNAGATSTVSMGKFCLYATDETNRGMYLKLSISGTNVFSTSTTPCQ